MKQLITTLLMVVSVTIAGTAGATTIKEGWVGQGETLQISLDNRRPFFIENLIYDEIWWAGEYPNTIKWPFRHEYRRFFGNGRRHFTGSLPNFRKHPWWYVHWVRHHCPPNVPEPSTALLFSIGLFLVIAIKDRLRA